MLDPLFEMSKKVLLRFGSWNVGTMKARSNEIVEVLSRRRVDACCVQETRWRGGSARFLSGKDCRYKFFWSGNSSGTNGVGILLAEKWVEKVLQVERISDRLLLLKMIVGTDIVNILSAYVPQVGLSDDLKTAFYELMLTTLSKISNTELLLLNGDFNGHVGVDSQCFEGIHGGFGFGERNNEGRRLLDFAAAHGLAICNTFFRKQLSHLVTYESGDSRSQIDFILTRQNKLKFVKDCKVFPGEECVPQHKLLVCDMYLKPGLNSGRKFVPKPRIWKLKDPEVIEAFEDAFSTKLNSITLNPDNVESAWSCLKTALLESTKESCGLTKKGTWRHETWWWNEEVDELIKVKRKLWKAWKNGESKENYIRAKRAAKHAVYKAKKNAEQTKFANLKENDQRVFKIARQLRRENADVVGEKCVRMDDGRLSYTNEDKKLAWKQHYEKLLNIEFDWDSGSLPETDPVAGPAISISIDMVTKAIQKMKSGKAPGPSGIVVEMIRAAGKPCVQLVTDLVNAIIHHQIIPHEWNDSYILNLFKGKGCALERGNYRGLKLTELVSKILERILESLIREVVDIDAMQFGFMPGRGTTDAIFIARQLQEKYLNKGKHLYFAFIDLEKAFDRVPRKVLWWSMRVVGVPEWIINIVKSLYADAKSRVRVDGEFSDEFPVKVGVHQGGVLSPLLFVIVLEALSRAFRTGCPLEMLYADDLVLMAETLDDLLVKLKSWKTNLETKGLKVNVVKTKLMISGKKLNPLVDSGRYPCGVCRKGVGNNSILCTICSHWVHKKCSNVSGNLTNVASFRCDRCLGIAPSLNPTPLTHVTLDGNNFEVVSSFCYLGDFLSAGGGCELSIATRIRSAWKKFRELLPILTCKSISLKSRGKVYSACVRGVLLHASECWAPKVSDLQRLKTNERWMLRWMFGSKSDWSTSTSSLLQSFFLPCLDDVLRSNRLRWLGHVLRSDGWINRCYNLVLPGPNPRGRPLKTWQEVVSKDKKDWDMPNSAADRDAWRDQLRKHIQSHLI